MALPHFSFRLQLPGQELDSGAAEAAADLATPLPRSDADVAPRRTRRSRLLEATQQAL